ncbi:MBG domain-containing protein [Sphingobium sp. EM0848]|uniref:MBG domain-containing protein n=1 Tax=Sphingobium sp. EM0848 TaxID=2743473 RepID=UPI00159C3952|nr:MBG domain-containing protein [Sphingobium sp. EM0848]
MRARSSLALLRNASLVALLAAMPQVVRAQAFQGVGTVDFGSATIDSTTPGVDNITVNSAHATITWTPNDTATGGGAINFLTTGATVNFVANGSLGSNYVVLNRIVPTDQTRAVRLDGNINSDAAGSVWFYSPGGLLVGSTARINVGSLLLSTGDPVVDGSGDFMPTPGQFSIAGQTGSTSAVVVEAGAEVRAETVGQNNYIVAIAPRIQQDGLLSARGSVALVAAESADFAIDNLGLFNISVTAGSEVSSNTFTHTGSTGGPDAAAAGEKRRVYMVAVPKNNAITMAIESSGSIGFDIAGAASLDGNTIVLSAGHNIADSGTGNPIAVGAAGAGPADISIARGSYTSNSYVSAVGNVTVTDTNTGGSPDIVFASSLSIHADSTARLRAEQGTISVGGDLMLEADAGSTSAGMASLETGLAGTAVNIGGNLLVSASEVGTTSQFASGGTAQLLSDGGLITVGGSAVIAANAIGYDTSFGSGGTAFGGNASVTISGGGGLFVSGGSLTVDASAKGGTGGDSSGFYGGDAYGGLARVETAGGAITVAGALAINSSATAGDAGPTNGVGGEARASYEADHSAALLVQGAIATGGILLDVSAKGGSGSIGGNAIASSFSIAPNPGSVLTATGASLFDTSARGGSGAVGSGGYAIAGTVSADVGDSATTMDLHSSVGFNASAIGGNGASGPGGDATSGKILVAANAGTLKLASAGGSLAFDTSVQAGAGSTNGVALNGFALVSAATAATTILGTSAGGSPGDIAISAPIAIGGNSQLKFLAAGSINVAGTVTGSGASTLLTLQADSDGNAVGTVTAQSGLFNLTGTGSQIDIYYNPASFGTPKDFSSSVVAGNWTGYQLVNSLADLQAINNFLGQSFALNRDIDATQTAGWNGGAGFVPLGTGSTYSGNFDGLGHVITNLTVNSPGVGPVGLFATVGGPANQPAIAIRNIGLINANIIGGDNAGGLIGATANCGFCGAVKISNSFVTGTVAGQNNVGGLIGGSAMNTFVDGSHSTASVTGSGNRIGGLIGSAYHAIVTRSFATGNVTAANNSSEVGGLIGWHDYGSIDQSYASGNVVAGSGAQFVGGLTGTNWVSVTRSYALGDVIAGSGSDSVGGFVGQNIGPGYGTISASYSSGAVIAPGSTNVGGFVGNNAGGVITNSYWDDFTSGLSAGFGADTGTITNLLSVTSDPSQSGASNYAFGPMAYANLNSNDWIWIEDMTGSRAGTRPIGIWEQPQFQSGTASIGSIHQMQLISLVLDGNYRLSHDIDATETARLSGVWGMDGFIPLGTEPSFTGVFDGAGHVISGLSFNQPSTSEIGLFRYNDGTIRNLGLANVNILGGQGWVGALAASNAGLITGSFVTGSINSGGSDTGGLVGMNQSAGIIDNSWSGVTVSGSNYVGGIAGFNDGTIAFTFANGAVTGLGAGGLVGANSPTGSILNSYWDGEASGVSVACSIDGGASCTNAVMLTTAQSRLASSYAGWSLDATGSDAAIWRIYEGLSTPLLKSFLRPLMVGPTDATFAYDGTVPVLNAIPVGTDLTHIFGTAGISGISRNAGSHSVSYSGGLSSDQLGYNIIAAPAATLTITPASLILSAAADARSYDGSALSSGSVGVAGLQAGDTVGGLTQSFDSANAGARTLVVDTGYTINDGNGGNNYTISFNTASGTIAPVALSIAANNDARTYNAVAYSGGNGVTYSGFVNGETSTVLGGALSYTGSSQGAVNAGSYVITPGGLTSGNYSITYVDGALTISPAALLLSASPDARSYDATTGSTGTVGIIGLQGTDSITGLAQSFDSANAGARTLSVNSSYMINDGNGGANYVVTLASASGSITPAAATITYTANPASITYGNAPGVLTGTESASGLFGSDSLATVTTGTAVYSTSANALSGVGSYAVTGSGLAGNSANYSFSFVQAPTNATAYSIIARAVTVTGDFLSRLYGDANPALTYTIGGAGLVNGDMLTGSLTTTANGLSSIGSYAVMQGTLAVSPNYALTYVNGSLGVTPRPLIITADPASRLQSDPNPSLTYTVGGNGLVNSDSLSGVLATTATIASLAGVYPITQGTLAASANYAVTFTGNDLTVLPCGAANGCAGSTVPMIANQVSSSVQQQEQSATSQTEEEQKEQAAAESTGNPKVVVNSVIDTRNVSQPPPVNEPVSGTGNSSLWIPGDQ